MSSNPLKSVVQKFFGIFGLQISRKKKEPQLWGTGNLTTIEENSMEIYDKFYSDSAALDKYYQGLRMEFYRDVVSQLREHQIPVDGRAVLDAGCGVGFLLKELSSAFKPASLSGSDFSEEAMVASRERFPDMTFFQHDICLPLQTKYDIIICTEVLEHLLEPWKGLQNLREALNTGGCLVLTVPEGRKDYSHEHINFWSPESWKAFLARECSDAKSINAKVVKDIFNFAIVQF